MPVRPASPAATILAVTTALALGLTACGEPTTRGAAQSPDAAGQSSAAPAGLDQILQDGVITVGTEGTYKPFTFHEGGTGDLTGYDIEIMDAVAGKLGVKVEYVETQWDAIFAGLDSGRFDVIANQVSINDERKKTYDFSTPYTISPGVIVVKKDDEDITSFADLKGKTTAQSLTSNWYEVAKGEGAKVEAVEGWAQAVTLLKQGRVDATVNDILTFLDWQQTEGDTTLKIAAESEDTSKNAFAFRKGEDELVAAVDKALADLAADGTLTTISEKYFGQDVSQ